MVPNEICVQLAHTSASFNLAKIYWNDYKMNETNYFDKEVLMRSSTNTPPFTMAFKTKYAKITAVLREDTVAAVMMCDGNPHQFIVKLRGVGCFRPGEETKKTEAIETLTDMLVNKIVTLRCYIHTSYNELICSLRIGGKNVIRELLDEHVLNSFSHQAHMEYYPPAHTGLPTT